MIKQALKDLLYIPLHFIYIAVGVLVLGFLIWVYTPWKCNTISLGDDMYKTTCVIEK